MLDEALDPHMARTVAVDFDGVLHPYTQGWVGSRPADEPPIEGAKAFLIALKAQGYRVVVFSVRANHPAGLVGILDWLVTFDLERLVDEVTYIKPPALAYVDDRAVPFHGDWLAPMAEIHRLADLQLEGPDASLR